MTRPLGKLQLELLMGLSSPSMMMVVGSAISKSLVKRGLLKPNFPNNPEAWHRLTPSGMRVLADAYEAGQLDQFMRKFPPAPPTLPPSERNADENTGGGQ